MDFSVSRVLVLACGERGGRVSYVRVRIRERMIAGTGKKMRKRSVRTLRLPMKVNGRKDSRHCAACSLSVELDSENWWSTQGGELTSWVWCYLP